jgi:hypothetical protein
MIYLPFHSQDFFTNQYIKQIFAGGPLLADMGQAEKSSLLLQLQGWNKKMINFCQVLTFSWRCYKQKTNAILNI